MARRYQTLDPYLACPNCGRHWPERDQACSCDPILGSCCQLPLFREYHAPSPPRYPLLPADVGAFVVLLVGVILGEGLMFYGTLALGALTR